MSRIRHMPRWRRNLTLALCVFAGALGSAGHADQRADGSTSAFSQGPVDPQLAESPPDVLMELDVLNGDGVPLGHVEDVVRDNRSGGLLLIVAYRQGAELGEKYFAVPIEAFRMYESNLRLRQTLKEQDIRRLEAAYLANRGHYHPIVEETALKNLMGSGTAGAGS